MEDEEKPHSTVLPPDTGRRTIIEPENTPEPMNYKCPACGSTNVIVENFLHEFCQVKCDNCNKYEICDEIQLVNWRNR